MTSQSIEQEKDDDFFGNQSDDDNGPFLSLNCTEANPQQASSQTVNGLAHHESRAIQESFRNIGYHEAYDESKEVKLQEGFEAGYREVIDVSVRIGKILGEVSTKSILNLVDESPPDIAVRKKISDEVANMVTDGLEHLVKCADEDHKSYLNKLERKLVHKVERKA